MSRTASTIRTALDWRRILRGDDRAVLVDMLRSLRDLERYSVTASDGDIGKVVSFLLDDRSWVVRYLVVATGGLLGVGGRRVQISPIAFRDADWSSQRFHLALTMDEVEHSPRIDVDQPVSVQGDAHVRSADEVRGYHVLGNEEAVGHIDDFVLDDHTWAVQYLVIDTSHWWFGKKVLVSPSWTRRICDEDRRLYLDMSRQMIKDSPEWDMNAAVNREYETRLYDYYGRPVYWASDRPDLAPEHASSPPRR